MLDADDLRARRIRGACEIQLLHKDPIALGLALLFGVSRLVPIIASSPCQTWARQKS